MDRDVRFPPAGPSAFSTSMLFRPPIHGFAPAVTRTESHRRGSPGPARSAGQCRATGSITSTSQAKLSRLPPSPSYQASRSAPATRTASCLRKPASTDAASPVAITNSGAPAIRTPPITLECGSAVSSPDISIRAVTSHTRRAPRQARSTPSALRTVPLGHPPNRVPIAPCIRRKVVYKVSISHQLSVNISDNSRLRSKSSGFHLRRSTKTERNHPGARVAQAPDRDHHRGRFVETVPAATSPPHRSP